MRGGYPDGFWPEIWREIAFLAVCDVQDNDEVPFPIEVLQHGLEVKTRFYT